MSMHMKTAARPKQGHDLVDRKLMVIGGGKTVCRHYDNYAKDLNKYNKRLQLLESPFVIRGHHTSGNKVYHGRYIYVRYYDEAEDVMKQKYVGTEIPVDMAPVGGFPSCPNNPLEGLECQLIKDNVILTEEMYEMFLHLFLGYVVVPIEWG